MNRWITAGTLGSIQFVHMVRTGLFDFNNAKISDNLRWFVDRSKSGGGAFLDLGCHITDLLMYFSDDELDECQLKATVDPDLRIELGGLASLKFKKGTLATLFASRQFPIHDNIVQI